MTGWQDDRMTGRQDDRQRILHEYMIDATKYVHIKSTTVVGIGTLPPSFSPASVPLPPETGGRGHTSLRVGGWGKSQFRRGAYTVVLFICTYFVLYAVSRWPKSFILSSLIADRVTKRCYLFGLINSALVYESNRFGRKRRNAGDAVSLQATIGYFQLWAWSPTLLHIWKGHGNEADFLGFLQKLVPHRSLTLPFEPFRFWLRIRRDIVFVIEKRLPGSAGWGVAMVSRGVAILIF